MDLRSALWMISRRCSVIMYKQRDIEFLKYFSLLFSRQGSFGSLDQEALVPRRRLELPRPCGHRHLKPARLPIPPPGQAANPLHRFLGAGGE